MEISNATWFKSSYSGSEVNCLEVARLPDRVAVRDSKNPHAAPLVFDPAAWTAFLARLRREE